MNEEKYSSKYNFAPFLYPNKTTPFYDTDKASIYSSPI